MIFTHYLGIDISKKTLDAALIIPLEHFSGRLRRPMRSPSLPRRLPASDFQTVNTA